jgi:hypothetical protein
VVLAKVTGRLEMIVLKAAPRAVFNAADQDFMRDQALHCALRPGKELMAIDYPQRTLYNLGEALALGFIEFRRTSHGAG